MQSADDCLHEKGAVEIFIRARAEPIIVTRLNMGQFTVRLFAANGSSYDVAYSAIEATKYIRHSKFDVSSC